MLFRQFVKTGAEGLIDAFWNVTDNAEIDEFRLGNGNAAVSICTPLSHSLFFDLRPPKALMKRSA